MTEENVWSANSSTKGRVGFTKLTDDYQIEPGLCLWEKRGAHFSMKRALENQTINHKHATTFFNKLF
jgi:hypothetical protein